MSKLEWKMEIIKIVKEMRSERFLKMVYACADTLRKEEKGGGAHE